MKPNWYCLALLLAATGARGGDNADLRSVEVGRRPESVAKGFNGSYFVTVMNDPKTPGDGVVRVINGDFVRDFATGLDEPKGICFTGEFLITTDVRKVWKIDAKGAATVLAKEADFLMPIQFLNDIAAAPDGQSVYVTDMGAYDRMRGPDGLWPVRSLEAAALPAVGRVYRIWLSGQVDLIIGSSPRMACPNGVGAGRGESLLVAEFFHGNLLSWQRGRMRLLASGYRGADGIEQDSSGRIYVSSWTQGKLWRLSSSGRKEKVVVEGLRSAADFCLDEANGQIILPDMLAGKVYFIPIP